MNSSTSHPDLKRLHLLANALAAGDSLGSTSEFTHQSKLPALHREMASTGWPFRQVGGGVFDWEPGEPTDDTDMAMCLLRSFAEQGSFAPEDLATRFVGWLDSDPPDIGGTTRRVLSDLKQGTPWHEAGRDLFRVNPGLEANGSLMRNAVVAGMASELSEIWRVSLLHGCITHYAPQPVVCCAAQVDLIHCWLTGRDVDPHTWPGEFIARWRLWLDASADPHVRAWFDEVGLHLEPSIEDFLASEFAPDRFNPFEIEFGGRDGHCLLTLQIGVWAAFWAKSGKPFPLPQSFSAEVFAQAVGPRFIAAVAMIGHDSDTYAATAGPMIAAATGELPEEFLEGLIVRDELNTLFSVV